MKGSWSVLEGVRVGQEFGSEIPLRILQFYWKQFARKATFKNLLPPDGEAY